MFDPGKITRHVIDGKTWTVGRLERAVIFAFRDYIREQIGDPFATLDRLKPYLSPEELLTRVKAAEATAKDLAQFSLGTATARAYMATELGMSRLLHLLLIPAHPDATEDDAFRLMLSIGAAAAAKALSDAAGSVPGGNAEAPGTPGTDGSTGTASA